MCVDIIPNRYGYVMAVLSGAWFVRTLCVCVWLPLAEGSPAGAPGIHPSVLGGD